MINIHKLIRIHLNYKILSKKAFHLVIMLLLIEFKTILLNSVFYVKPLKY